MKKSAYAIFMLAALIVLFLANSCKKDEKEEGVDEDIPQTTKIISESDWADQIHSMDTTDYTFYFDGSMGLEEGDILVTSADGGYLRKVTSVSQDGSNEVVETEFASIVEAVRNAEADFTQSLIVDQAKLKSAYFASGVTIDEQSLRGSDETGLNLNIDFVIYDEDNNMSTTGDQIKFSGNFNTNTEFNAKVKIRNFSLEQLAFTYDIQKEKSLDVTCGLASIGIEKETRIARIPFHDIIIPAGIPITIQPVLEVYAGIGFELNSQIEMGIIETVNYTATVSYENGKWSTAKTVDETFNYTPPTLTAGLEATAYIKPKLLFKIYRVLSPKVEANLYGMLEAHTRAIDWSLSEGFNAGLGVEMKIWDKSLIDFSVDLIDLNYVIAEGTIGAGLTPIANFSADPISGQAPLTVNFTDLSINNPTSWQWDFGDEGTSALQNPSHTYNSSGTYTVVLTATNTYGSDIEEKTGYIVVSAAGSAPVVAFTGSPTNGTAPLTVDFADQSANSPTSWQWNFGDGGTSALQNPSHTYNSSGTYTVKLTAINTYGSDIEEKTGYIVVSTAGSAPVAAFIGSPTNGTAPLTVDFADQSANSPTSWQWNFGDGGTSVLQNPSHTYNAAGTYTVELEVSNGYGSDTEAKNNYITVTFGGGTGEPCPGIPTITYQGQTYNTVLIGSQCWMKENLNYATGNSWCYNNNSSNCDTYGRLYDWETIMDGESSSNGVPSGVQGICPSGWHIPSDEEWKILEGTVDSQYGLGDPEWDDDEYRGYDAGKNLKATSGWNSGGNGTDLCGFTALPGGSRYTNGSFNDLGFYGRWWSSTEYSGSNAWYRYLYYGNDAAGRYNNFKTYGLSLRCLKD